MPLECSMPSDQIGLTLFRYLLEMRLYTPMDLTRWYGVHVSILYVHACIVWAQSKCLNGFCCHCVPRFRILTTLNCVNTCNLDIHTLLDNAIYNRESLPFVTYFAIGCCLLLIGMLTLVRSACGWKLWTVLFVYSQLELAKVLGDAM